METLKKFQKTMKIFSILLGLLVVLLPLPVLAQENSGSIHIEQLDTDTKKPVSGIKLDLYKIADTNKNNTYELTEAFRQVGLKVEILLDGDNYEKSVKQLDQYIEENQVSYLNEKISDSDGKINYQDLVDGIYFVKQNNSKQDFERLGYSYKTDSYIVILPGRDKDGDITRNIYCKPKGKIEYPKKDTSITVYKVWKDENNKEGNRPSSVIVGLYCDQELQEKIILNDANNWTHQWTHLNTNNTWEIKEIDVPKGYSSEITKDENTYTITNKWTPTKTIANSKKTNANIKTGDFSHIMLYIICGFGTAIILILLVRKKEKEYS